MSEKIISIRLSNEEITKLTILRNTLIKNFSMEFNTSQIIKFCLNKTYAEILSNEIQQNNR